MRIQYLPGAIRLAEIPQPSDLLSVDDAALALTIVTGKPITAANLRQHAANGRGPAVHRAGSYKPLYPWAAALDWYENRTETRGRKRHSTSVVTLAAA